MGDARRRDLMLGHGFEERRLHLGRGAVDLVDEDEAVEDRTRHVFEGAAVRPEDRAAREIGRHQIRRALNAREGRMQTLGEKLDGAGLGEPRRALDQKVAAGQQADQQPLDEDRAADEP